MQDHLPFVLLSQINCTPWTSKYPCRRHMGATKTVHVHTAAACGMLRTGPSRACSTSTALAPRDCPWAWTLRPTIQPPPLSLSVLLRNVKRTRGPCSAGLSAQTRETEKKKYVLPLLFFFIFSLSLFFTRISSLQSEIPSSLVQPTIQHQQSAACHFDRTALNQQSPFQTYAARLQAVPHCCC